MRDVLPMLTAVALLAAPGCGGRGPSASTPQELHIDVTQAGFVPARKVVPKGRPLVLVFTRKTDQTCGTDVIFPALHRGYDLPMDQEVRVELTADEVRDTLFYSCSMKMLNGMIVAK